MNKWAIVIVGALVFLGVTHYIEQLEFEEYKPYEDWDYMQPFIFPHVNVVDLYENESSGFALDSWDMIESYNFTWFLPNHTYSKVSWSKENGFVNETGKW